MNVNQPMYTHPQMLPRKEHHESIGQIGFIEPFSQQAIHRDASFTSSPKKIKWDQNVKNGRNTVGCVEFQRGCAAFPTSFDDDAAPFACGDTERPRSLLQRFTDVTISNLQKCGVGIGQQCQGRAVNVSLLSSMIGGAMCTRCGVVDNDGCGFDQANCLRCQGHFPKEEKGNIGLRGHEKPNTYSMLGPMCTTPNYRTNNLTVFEETTDAIIQSRDAFILSQNPMMVSRLDDLRVQDDAVWNEGAVDYEHYDADENDRYAMNYKNVNRTRLRRFKGNRITMKERTKRVGRCVAKSLSNPIGKLKNGMQRTGAKRVLTITRGR